MMCQSLLASLGHAVMGASLLQVTIPLWALVHLPVVITLSTACFTPKVRHEMPGMLSCCPAVTCEKISPGLRAITCASRQFETQACVFGAKQLQSHAC